MAAELLRRRFEKVEYLVSYEIVTNAFGGLCGFEPDGRTVTQGAVDRVMRTFFRTFAPATRSRQFRSTARPSFGLRSEDPCDDEFLEWYIAGRTDGV